jgi:hypothetical protein
MSIFSISRRHGALVGLFYSENGRTTVSETSVSYMPVRINISKRDATVSWLLFQELYQELYTVNARNM